jgi:hypothetical protein
MNSFEIDIKEIKFEKQISEGVIYKVKTRVLE